MGGAYQRKTYRIADLSEGARMIFLENPYSILGISCMTPYAEALAQADKLKKLSSFQAADLYVSGYDLSHVERINRNDEVIDAAVSQLEALEHSWLWFATPMYVRTWHEADHTQASNAAERYDAFLADYVAALIIDSKFHDTRRWRAVLTELDDFLEESKQNLYEFLSARLRVEFLKKFNIQEVLDSFCKTILRPIFVNVQYADGKALMDLLPDLFRFYHIQEDFQEQLKNSVISWSEKALNELREFKNSAINNTSRINEESDISDKLDALLASFFNGAFPAAKELSTYFDNDFVNSILSKFADTVYLALVRHINDFPLEKACNYISQIYIYIRDDLKKEIKSRYPLEKLQIPESEFTGSECKKIAWAYDNDGNRQPDLYYLWMNRAADRGDAEAMNAVGCCYASGKGCEKDKAQAAEWFRKSAYAGSDYGWSNLALYHKYGYGGLKKDDIAEFNCRILAFFLDPREKRLDDLQKYNVHWKVMFSEQFGFKFDSDEDTLSKLAAEGNTYSRCFLGFAHYHGYREFDMDEELSMRELLDGSLEGCPWASPLLSAFYSIDDKEADTGEAMYLLAEEYYNYDDYIAFYWYKKAVAAGYSKAYLGIGYCYDNGVGTAVDEEAATKYYALAVIEDDKNADALFEYGYALYNGNGTERDLPRAKEHLKKSAELGNKEAAEFLAEHFAVTKGYEIELDKLKMSVKKFDLGMSWHNLTLSFDNGSWDKYHVLAQLSDDNDHYSKWQRVASIDSLTYGTVTISLYFQQEANYLRFDIRDDEDETVSFTDVIKIGRDLYQSSYYEATDEVRETLFYGFRPRTLYHKSGIHVILNGINLAMNVPLLALHVQNESGASISLWLVNLYLDDKSIYDYTYLGKCSNEREDGYSIPLPQFPGDNKRHCIKLNIQIDDMKDFPVAATGTVEISVDLETGETEISRA